MSTLFPCTYNLISFSDSRVDFTASKMEELIIKMAEMYDHVFILDNKQHQIKKCSISWNSEKWVELVPGSHRLSLSCRDSPQVNITNPWCLAKVVRSVSAKIPLITI